MGDDASCASGRIININDYEFEHDISTDNGSSGCPILLLHYNINFIHVIGIHKDADYSRKLNGGTFICEILKEEFEIDEAAITPDAPIYQTLELDSLSLVDLIGIVQTKYGVLISKAELPTIKTFAQLYDYIEQHQK